jgi:hypothetical protein
MEFRATVDAGPHPKCGGLLDWTPGCWRWLHSETAPRVRDTLIYRDEYSSPGVEAESAGRGGAGAKPYGRGWTATVMRTRARFPRKIGIRQADPLHPFGDKRFAAAL